MKFQYEVGLLAIHAFDGDRCVCSGYAPVHDTDPWVISCDDDDGDENVIGLAWSRLECLKKMQFIFPEEAVSA